MPKGAIRHKRQGRTRFRPFSLDHANGREARPRDLAAGPRRMRAQAPPGVCAVCVECGNTDAKSCTAGVWNQANLLNLYLENPVNWVFEL